MISKVKGSNSHYCIVSFFPARMTDKAFFEFQGGRFFTKEDMEEYIIWFMTHQRLFIDEIEYRVPRTKLQELRKEDKFIDLHSCSRGEFKQLKKVWKTEATK